MKHNNVSVSITTVAAKEQQLTGWQIIRKVVYQTSVNLIVDITIFRFLYHRTYTIQKQTN